MDKFIVLGPDARMKNVYEYLIRESYDACYIDNPLKIIEDEEDIILVLPPKPDIDIVKAWLKSNRISMIIGGACDRELYTFCEIENIELADYLKCPEVIEENALLTAKGIIRQTIDEHLILENRKCLVLGYGNCGKAIAKQLALYNCDITIAVRKEGLKPDIEKEGFRFTNIARIDYISDYEYIYNTVPAPVLEEELIDSLNHKCVIYDIASKPGGTDFEYAIIKGIEAHLSLGIPGKMYPVEAGDIIARYIIKLFNKKI